MAVAELPDDVDALKAMVVAMAEQRALLEARTRHLEATNETRLIWSELKLSSNLRSPQAATSWKRFRSAKTSIRA